MQQPEPQQPDWETSIYTMPQPPLRARQATGQRIRHLVKIFCVVLLVGFVLTFISKFMHAHQLAKSSREMAEAAPVVEVVTAAPAPATAALKLPGETAAWYESVIYARVDGYVAKWVANIGDTVKKGQVLATIETPDLDAQLVASQAKLKAAQALIKAKEAEAEFAKTTYARWKDSPKGVVSEQERESKKAGYTSALAAYNEAQAQAALAQADVDRYTVLAKFKQVIAPYDGKITERHIDIGNLVTAGSTANTSSLYRIAQNSPIRVFVDVPQNAAADMKPGLGATVTTAGQTIPAKIARTADAINQQARTLKVEVDLPNRDGSLVSGMYVDVAFDIPTQGLLTLPAAAILFRANGPEVAVVGADGHVQFHKVTIARDDGTNVEVSAGVVAGDRVALNISNQIADGEMVTVNEPKEGAEHAATPAQ